MPKNLITTSRNKVKNWLYIERDYNQLQEDISNFVQGNFPDFQKKYDERDKKGNYKSDISMMGTIRRTYNELSKSKQKIDKDTSRDIKNAYKKKKKKKTDLWDLLSITLPQKLKYSKNFFMNGIYIDAMYNDIPVFSKSLNWAFRLTSLLTLFENLCMKNLIYSDLLHTYRVTLKYTYRDFNGNYVHSYISTKALQISQISSDLSRKINSLIQLTAPFISQTNFSNSPKLDDLAQNNEEIISIDYLKIDCYLKQLFIAQLQMSQIKKRKKGKKI